MNYINDLNDPQIKYYTSLKYTPKIHKEENVFIAEGKKVVEKVLKSNLEVISFFGTIEQYELYKPLIINKIKDEKNILIADKSLMEKIVGYKLHSGIMAMAKIPPFAPLDKLNSPIVVLNHLNNVENVGVIVRNCSAFSVNSLIFDKQTASPYLRRAVRVSVGNVINMKIHYAENLIETLTQLKNIFGYQIYSAEITETAIELDKIKFPEKFALVFGNEDSGVDKNILELSDKIVKIPISPNVSSLNVAISNAIILYEFSRTR